MSVFIKAKKLVQERFQEFQNTGKKVLRVDVDRDKIWDIYISAFSDDLRGTYTCSCCKSFIRQAGGAVIVVDGEVRTLWEYDPELPDRYKEPFAQLDIYVKSLPIMGEFKHVDSSIGTDRSPDTELNVVWEHFYTKLPNNLVGEPNHELRTSVQVLRRGLDEISLQAVDTVLELIAQGSVYRGSTYKRQLSTFAELKRKHDPNSSGIEYWDIAVEVGETVARIRNSAIGQLLQDLTSGRELGSALTAFERIVAPTNYKRPKSSVTPRMVEEAKKKLASLDLLPAMSRRILDSRDLSVADALFIYRPDTAMKDVFAEIIDEVPVNQAELNKVEEMSAQKFVADVLPTVKSARVLIEQHLLGNFVTLTGPQDTDSKPLFNWNNSYGWSYTGGVADSIRQRVKAAGGDVDGWGRFSLAWYNSDDLDIHFHKLTGDSSHTYFSNQRGRYARLDVDMNADTINSTDPVENIHIPKQLPSGKYKIVVNNFSKRSTNNLGFEVEADIGGVVRHFSSTTSPGSTRNAPPITFSVQEGGEVVFDANKLSNTSRGTNKWGLKTGVWTDVNAVTLSPNHWGSPVGNKHLFFLLKGCVSDEKTRPFYNEFLTPELAKERKVTEVLGSKVEVAPADGAELSGLGFSDTIRNHMFVEVTGKFKRTIKIKF